MEKKLLKRLIALVLTGGVLISSTGVYTALAATEESTTSEYTSALVGSENAETTVPETTTDGTTEPTTSGNTEVESITESVTESTTADVQKPVTTQKPETTTKPPVIEEIVETPSNNGAVEWKGVDGTETQIGSQSNPYDVSSVQHFLSMNDIIKETNNSDKYFRLTKNLDFSGVTIDSTLIETQGQYGMEGSLVSINPSLISSNVFFHFDGNGKTIENITIEDDDHAFLSVFGYVNAASTIENLTVKGVTIINKYADAQAAGVILKNDGTVKNCSFTVIELETDSSTKAESFYATDDESLRVYSGTAIVVDNIGTIDNETDYDSSLTSIQNVTVRTKRPYAGVLVAQNRGTINKVRATYITVDGDVANSDYVGGLVGGNFTARSSSSKGIYYAEILSNANSGGVKGADKIGYLAGYNTGRIQRSTVVGNHKSSKKATSSDFDILVTGSNAAGGIVGENTGDVQLCTARNIGVYFADSSDEAIYGGIVGKTTYGVRNCIATGSTAGEGTAHTITRYIGGIVGYGDTSSAFSVENCYALVKIIDSKIPLGAIVGYNGDTAYRNNKVRNVFYSGIISSRPSPVSYGGAGESEGDLTFSKPYAVAYYYGDTISVKSGDFSFSGWGKTSFAVKGNFKVNTGSSGASSYTVKGSGTGSFEYDLTGNGKSDKTVVNYDVDITLPSGVGADKNGTVLENEPMEFGILNSNFDETSGDGSKGNPFALYYCDLNFLYYAPAAHFKASSEFMSTWNMQSYSVPSATFWGTVDFGEINAIRYEINGVSTPLFKGIYGSRDDSLKNNKVEDHKSSSDDLSDKEENLAYGVVKNANFEVGVSSISAIMGSICNATVKNITIGFGQNDSSISATEGNTGLFAKSVHGNSYIYGCYVDSTQLDENGKIVLKNYESSTFDGVSGFIGTIDAEKTIIDNCGINLVVVSKKSNASDCAVFVGKIKALHGGYIQNCYASGGLTAASGSYDTSSSYIFAGSIDLSSTQIHNCYFSPSYYYKNNKGIASGIKAGSYTGSCKLWSFVQESATSDTWTPITMQVSTAETNYAYVETINNIDRFDISNTNNLSDKFEVSTNNSDIVTLNSIRWFGRVGFSYEFEGGNNSNAIITIKNNATGLMAKLTVYSTSDLEIADGYYLIKSPVDLYWLSSNQNARVENTADEYKYVRNPNVKFKIAADIDMTGYTIERPIGSSTHYFQGEFVAGQDDNGRYYTISNLNFGDGNFAQSLFGYVQGAKIKGIHIDNASINSDKTYTAALVANAYDNVTIEDCKVTNSTISGKDCMGAILGGVLTDTNSENVSKTIITNCTVENTTITSSSAEGDRAYVGGIVGNIDVRRDGKCAADITGCKVINCEITSKGYGIGGIVGYASNNDNKVSSCTVTGTKLICDGNYGSNSSDPSIGGIVGIFGGYLISDCNVNASEITGECAAGIVTRLINEQEKTSSILRCTVSDTVITAPKTAAGILAQVSQYGLASVSCIGDKIVDECKVSADTSVKAEVAGGIVGNIESYSNGKITVSDCTNLGRIATTGKKGSRSDGAGGIIGRIASAIETSGVSVKGCLSQGILEGNSNLGGIIGVNSANEHTSENKLVSKCYVTTEFSSKNLTVSKGIVIGFYTAGNSENVSKVAEEVYYSSLDVKAPLYGGNNDGNINVTAQSGGGFDMNLGADQTGITVDVATKLVTTNSGKRSLPYTLQSVYNYKDGILGTSNVIELKENFYFNSDKYDGYGSNLSNDYGGVEYKLSRASQPLVAATLPCFSVDNLPSLTGTDGNAFVTPENGSVFTTSANPKKILVGYKTADTTTPDPDNNTIESVSIQTFDKKCEAVVKTKYTGVINGETVTFDVGFKVIVKAPHKFLGEGTKTDPFQIYDAEDILAIKQHHDKPDENDLYSPEYYYQAYYRVHNDIDMSEVLATSGKSFAPIGTAEEPFKGHFYSRVNYHYTISNMLINRPGDAEGYDYAYKDDYDAEKFSDALGVFGYTDGAEISDITFENINYSVVASTTNKSFGIKTGGVVGVAKNTTINNVEVTGLVNINVVVDTNDSLEISIGATGGIVGKAEDNVILNDVTVRGADNDENVANISGLHQVGGIVGTSADATGCSITNALVENANVFSNSVTGSENSGGTVGGIAGQYSGIISGSFETDDKGEVVEKRTTVRNVSVMGIVVGGIVGSGNINTTTEDHPLTIKLVDVTKTNIEVNESLREDKNRGTNGIAGGILGNSCEKYHYLLEDCNVNADTIVISGYCAGGVVGKVQNSGTESSLFIRNCSTSAKVQQLDVIVTDYMIGKENLTGVGSVIGIITQAAEVMNTNTHEPQIQITDSMAGGTIAGTYNVGGIIGQFATDQRDLNKLTEPLVYNCIVAARITVPTKTVTGSDGKTEEKQMAASERFGIILGSIEGNQKKEDSSTGDDPVLQTPFPETKNGVAVAYKSRIFDKIFYSSYTAGTYNLYGISVVNSYSVPDKWNYADGFAAAEALSVYTDKDKGVSQTVYDVNHVMYNFKSPTDGSVTKLPVSVVMDSILPSDVTTYYQWFGSDEYTFSDEFVSILNDNEGWGDPFGFSIAGKEFTLAENGVQSANKDIFEVVPNPDANMGVNVLKKPYKIMVKKFDTADMVFTYTNGLQIGMPIVCGVNFEGEGTSENPIQVANEDIFYHIVKVLPSYSFVQTADLDLSDKDKYPATSTAQILANFTGTYDGWNEEEQRNYTISGFNVNISGAETPVGIFGKVSGQKLDENEKVIPNIQNVTFIGCTVNSGNTSAGTGVVAGAITDGATISNVKVEKSVATSHLGTVGGITGIVSGATTLENVEVTDNSKVTAAAGSAGGIVGVITEDAVKVIAPKVSSVEVTSGGASKEDIAGGIVAQAVGTITGPAPTTDEDDNVIFTNAVEKAKVQAYISGGAVGTVYTKFETQYTLNMSDIRVAETEVIAKANDTIGTAVSGAGLLGFARGETDIVLDNCYVTKTTTASSVSSSGYSAYGAGAVAQVSQDVNKLHIIDTESYATVSASESKDDGTVYAAGLVGHIDSGFDINKLKFDGSVAGGKITGKAMKTFVAGVIGELSNDITSEITGEFFTNGVISAELECIDGNTTSTQKAVHRRGKFIAGYKDSVFAEANFSEMFQNNYYSTYPDDIAFFATETDTKGPFDTTLAQTENAFININVPENLSIADENRSSWNSVAITKDIGSDTKLFARLGGDYAELRYGSKDENGESTKVSVAAGGFSLVESVDEEGKPINCIDFDPDTVYPTENSGEFEFTVTPTKYGAETLIAEYTCGLKTTAQIISVEIKGTGAENDPFLISTPTQLRVVAYLATGNKYFRQINDIDLSGSYKSNGETDEFIHYNSGKFSVPIGTDTAPFDGVYDGQGYKITEFKINRPDETNIGLFGVVESKGSEVVATVKNVHLELKGSDKTTANGIIGGTNVGGIAGDVRNGLIENCSVTVGSVTGKNNVGGIAGNFTDSDVINCFTQSDVNAFGNSKPYSGGIVGFITSAGNNSEVSGCFAAGSIYAATTDARNDRSNAAGIVGYIQNAKSFKIYNCLFTGTTSSGYGITAGNGFVDLNYSITDCIDAGQNVAMNNNEFGKIETAVVPYDGDSESTLVTKNNVYYDSALLKVDTKNYPDSKTGLKGLPTSDLTSPDPAKVTLGSGWKKTAGYYPVPEVSKIAVVTYAIDEEGNVKVNEVTDENGDTKEVPVITSDPGQTPSADKYSEAYARFLSIPVKTSEDEECNDINNDPSFVYGEGFVYPVKLQTYIGSDYISYSSSVFDTTDTVSYSIDELKGFDTHLYGVRTPELDEENNVVYDEDGNIVYSSNNKNVDLLFEDKSGYTTVYRNIFDTTQGIATKAKFEKIPEKNTYVNSGAAEGSVFANGEAYYNAQVPVVYATAEINDVKVQRDIKIPLSYGSYCIATQRQLYALGKADYELVENTKFSDYYDSTYNYKLITDIDCSNNDTLFTPIGLDVAAGYTGQFDGSGHKISNLKIHQTGENYVGMFSKVSKSQQNPANPYIKDLTLENATVVAESKQSGNDIKGGNYVGTLVGYVMGSGYIVIENCHAIGSVEYDAKGNIVEGSEKGTVIGDGSYVGGLIGRVDLPYRYDEKTGDYGTIVRSCSSSVMVTGSKDAVGGLIGQSGGTVSSCYATGNVVCDELTNGNVCGVGGLIGIMSNGTVTQSFASGNVEVKAFSKTGNNAVTRGQFGIGGFVGVVEQMKDPITDAEITDEVITECFSGGNVAFGTVNNTSSVVSANGETVIVGVGGFSGINREAISNAYSSAAIKTTFGNIRNGYDGSTYGVGVGGVAGVALAGISDVYSSGSVAPAYTSRDISKGTCHYGVGGTIGTTMNTSATYKYCYYDSWTNTDPNLTSIGDKSDSNDARSLTTRELTSGKRPSIGTWSAEVWGFTPNAYPYLKNLLRDDADFYIKTNSILSVVCVNVAEDDVSAKTGAGITQALTVPSEFKYTNDKNETVLYNLDWAGATLAGNLASINRTQNVREYVDVVAQVKGYEQYATRVYSRLCADMKGTFAQPYLIGNETDLAHVNMWSDDNVSDDELDIAKRDYPDFYGQWATPLGDGGEQVEGTVHYQLMSNVEIKDTDRNIPEAPETYTYTIISSNESGNETTETVTLNYQGFMLKGNGYAIKNVNTTGYYIEKVDEKSTITNIIFEDFTFTGGNSALIHTNDGKLIDVFVRSTMKDATENVAGLVQTNNGTIDGCLVDAKISGVTTDAGIMAVDNSSTGIIRNSGTAGSIVTSDGNLVKNVGAFVATNSGSISNSFSMADVDVKAEANADVQLLSGFAATNSGKMDGVYTRSALSFANEPKASKTIASLVGNLTNSSADAVTNSFAAGLLGYYNESQDSILFGTVPDGHTKLSSVYVDKSLAGEKSANSYKYSASLSSMMSMQYMADTMKYDETNNREGKFIAGEQSELVLPQLASILNAKNDMVVDEDGNLIYVDTTSAEKVTYTLFTENDEEGNTVRKYRCSDGNIYFVNSENDDVIDEDGNLIVKFSDLKLQYSLLLESETIIRNYDVIKAYSRISSMALKTTQSQYADRLAPNSSDTTLYGMSLNSPLSTADDVSFNPVSGTSIIQIKNGKVETAEGYGAESIRVNYNTDIELSRGTKINPILLIDVGVSKLASNNLNPNFNGGIGTKENPYRIAGTSSLTSLHYYGTESNLYFILDNDIEMKDVDDFQIHVFTAHLNDPESTGADDAQYVIRNFTSTSGEGGLFGRIENGAVVNNVALTGTVTGSEQYTGALANIIDGATVTNCVVSAEVTSTAQTDEYGNTPATGVLAGRVTNASQVSGIVTTGNATATAGAVGGVVGFAENTAMSEFVSTANVGEGAEVAGIIGTMGENATLTNALYGGEAESGQPIVASTSETSKVTNAYYDKQINKGIEEGTVIGEGKTSKECETVFGGNPLFESIGSGFYPVPAKMSGNTTSYDSVTAFATNIMTFYLGSNRGEIGFYTSMQFANKAAGSDISVSEEGITEANKNDAYFTIDSVGNVYVVKTAKYNESKNPAIVLTLENGAMRTVHPGLVRNANVSYTITNSSDLDVSGKLLGVLLKSVSNKTSTDSVNVLDDFTSEIGEKQTVDALVIADGMDGFYVGEMLPDGYEYEITATINGEVIDEDDITTEENIYGTFVKLPTGGEGDIKTQVELILKIVKSDKPWGVNSVENILW